MENWAYVWLLPGRKYNILTFSVFSKKFFSRSLCLCHLLVLSLSAYNYFRHLVTRDWQKERTSERIFFPLTINAWHLCCHLLSIGAFSKLPLALNDENNLDLIFIENCRISTASVPSGCDSLSPLSTVSFTFRLIIILIVCDTCSELLMPNGIHWTCSPCLSAGSVIRRPLIIRLHALFVFFVFGCTVRAHFIARRCTWFSCARSDRTKNNHFHKF